MCLHEGDLAEMKANLTNLTKTVSESKFQQEEYNRKFFTKFDEVSLDISEIKLSIRGFPEQTLRLIKDEEKKNKETLAMGAKIVTWILGTIIAIGVIGAAIYGFLHKNKLDI